MSRITQDSRVRVAILLVSGLGLLWMLTYLQGLFVAGDHRRAEQLLRSYRAHPDGPTLPELMVHSHPQRTADEVTCLTETLSDCHGFMRISCRVPGEREEWYVWDIDLVGGVIHPGNPGGAELMRRLEEPAKK